jgi:peptidoglycan/LPS O-acetylase OafA/YrhL
MMERRYVSLDAWRAVASIAIVFHHLYAPGETIAREYLGLGVPLFFVISGYCIAAAMDAGFARGTSVRSFLARRFRRIAPPYWGSLVLAVALSWWSHRANRAFSLVGELIRNRSLYWQNLTMVQWLTLLDAWRHHPPGIPAPWMNRTLLVGVYWSLNYEEQFYLVCAALLVVGRRSRAACYVGFALATLVALGFNGFAHGQVTGLFVDYWFQFACGAWVFVATQRGGPRIRAGIAVGLAVALVAFIFLAVRTGEVNYTTWRFQSWMQGSVCLAFSLVLIFLHGQDAWVRSAVFVRPLLAIGKMSYSLYLIHFQLLLCLGDYVRVLKTRFGLHLGVVFAAALLIPLVAPFYLLLERPFLRSKPPTPLPAPSLPSKVTVSAG